MFNQQYGCSTNSSNSTTPATLQPYVLPMDGHSRLVSLTHLYKTTCLFHPAVSLECKEGSSVEVRDSGSLGGGRYTDSAGSYQ
jgi:hypothetical protein